VIYKYILKRINAIKGLLARKPKLSTTRLSLATALFLTGFSNDAFWQRVLNVFDQYTLYNYLFVGSVFVLLTLFLNILLSFFSFKYVLKPLIITLLLTASIAGYFMDSYGTMIDANMIQNIMETDTHEAIELLNLRLFYYLTVWGLLPALFVYNTEIQYQVISREALSKLKVILISSIALVVVVAPFYQDYASLVRNNRELRHLINPINTLHAFHKYLNQSLGSPDTTVVAIEHDAKLASLWQQRGKKSLVILVLGETARAQSFSLNGYGRKTNPLLGHENIVNYTNVYSCGTSTATSVPCMFSHMTQDTYSDSKAKHSEDLLDVLAHAGIEVLWRDNNSGCKGVCNRVNGENMATLHVPELCGDKECFDMILLHKLQDIVNHADNDMFIVLHQKGSHGPAYYLRYPKEFEVFKPACQTNQLQACRQDEVANAYDNTIVYTDYFLEQVIGFLKKNEKRFNASMIYVSDHGESLGENNIYLHGLPYLIAPEEQTHVPFILWLSNGFEKTEHINHDCLKRQSDNKYSHDNLFHSVLGLMEVKTNVYNAELDMFSKCR